MFDAGMKAKPVATAFKLAFFNGLSGCQFLLLTLFFLLGSGYCCLFGLAFPFGLFGFGNGLLHGPFFTGGFLCFGLLCRQAGLFFAPGFVRSGYGGLSGELLAALDLGRCSRGGDLASLAFFGGAFGRGRSGLTFPALAVLFSALGGGYSCLALLFCPGSFGC